MLTEDSQNFQNTRRLPYCQRQCFYFIHLYKSTLNLFSLFVFNVFYWKPDTIPRLPLTPIYLFIQRINKGFRILRFLHLSLHLEYSLTGFRRLIQGVKASSSYHKHHHCLTFFFFGNLAGGKLNVIFVLRLSTCFVFIENKKIRPNLSIFVAFVWFSYFGYWYFSRFNPRPYKNRVFPQVLRKLNEEEE